MGPSGSGKTTLLDILAGKKKSQPGGEVFVNGRPRDRLFRRIATYVPQQDLMFPYATVEEAVLFCYHLKHATPANMTRAAAKKLSEGLLSVMGLLDVKDTMIGDDNIRGISGGQRRRLSMARGLACGAQLQFLDEPTSGLSATDADVCVRYMRLVSHKLGVTIVVVIHQPRAEVAKLFDHLLLLTSGPGRCVYNGSMRGAPEHWQEVGYPLIPFSNPTDFYLDLVTPGAPDACEEEFVEHFNKHCKSAIDDLVKQVCETPGKEPLELLKEKRENLLHIGNLPAVRNSAYAVGFRTQLLTILTRKLRLSMRDKQGDLMALIAAAVKAFVVGIAYLDIGDNHATAQIGFLFMVLMTCSLDGMVAMPRLIAERTIVKMEASEALYSQWVHMVVFTIFNCTLGVMQNSIFIIILFWMSGMPTNMFGCMYWITTLLYLTMDGMYGMIAAMARDATSAQVLSLPFLMLFMLYNGFTVSRNTVPHFMKWALTVSPVACSIEAVAIEASKTMDNTEEWDQLINIFGYQDHLAGNLETVAVMAVAFRVLQLVLFRTMNDIRR
jgi:ATP-binding cassette subfamily G (WHITE) protein 2